MITAAAFQDAPPPIRVYGRLVVPLHIIDLTARVKFDGAKQAATADATMTYIVGPTAGSPFFDLRQTVDRCWLDGHEIDPALVAARDVGAGPFSTVRVIDVAQRARSVHRLRIRYGLDIPCAGLGGAYPPRLTWTAGPRLRWSIAMSDLEPGRYLEAWFPSNLPFDQFPFALDLRLVGMPIRHTIITNGEVVAMQRNGWSIRFPRWFTTMSPLVEIRAGDQLQMAAGNFSSPISHRTIGVEAWKLVDGPEDLSTWISRITSLLAENETRYGEFVGEKFVCFFHGAAIGMEYSNATTSDTSALRHEVFHSWFARGVMPASQADGWWDEGFTRYNDDGADKIERFDFSESPVELCSRQPFQRSTPANAYVDGSRFFRGVSAAIGADRLRDAMRDLYGSKRRTPVSTGDFGSPPRRPFRRRRSSSTRFIGLSMDSQTRYAFPDSLSTEWSCLTDGFAGRTSVQPRPRLRSDTAGGCARACETTRTMKSAGISLCCSPSKHSRPRSLGTPTTSSQPSRRYRVSISGRGRPESCQPLGQTMG